MAAFVPRIFIDGVPVKDLGVTSLVFNLRDQDVSTAEIGLRGKPANYSQLVSGQTITIQADSFHFTGKIGPRPFESTGADGGGLSLVVRDLWGRLADQTVYGSDVLQNAAICQDTRLVLGGQHIKLPDDPETGDETGFELRPMALGSWLQKLATFAGITIAGGPPGLIPPAEGDGVKVAEAVKAVLRWFPGSVAFSAGSPNTVQIKAPQQMAPFVLPWAAHNGKVRVTPRTDLLVSGVTIYLRKIKQSSVASEEHVTVLSAGGGGPNAFIASLDLFPEVHTIAVAPLRVLEIKEKEIEFWQKLAPALFKEPGMDAATIRPGSTFVLREEPTLKYLIREGGISKEFQKGCSGPYLKGEKILECQNEKNPKIGNVRVQATFDLGGGSEYVAKFEMLAVGDEVNAPDDDLVRMAREDKDLKDAGEDPVEFADFATDIFAAASSLGHEGSVSWHVPGIPSLDGLALGKRFSFSGAPVAAWNEMAAPVFGVRIDCMTREITVEFGPNSYLGTADLLALERAHRGWNRTKKPRIRSTDGGEPDTSANPAPPVPPTISQPPTAGTEPLKPFEIRQYSKTQIQVGGSTYNGQPFTDAGPYLSALSSGVAFIETTLDETKQPKGMLKFAATTPASSAPGPSPTRRDQIGSWERQAPDADGNVIIACRNDRFGPFEAVVCRDWFASGSVPIYSIIVGGSSI